MTLLPTKTSFRPGEPVAIEVSPWDQPRRVRVEHLGTPVAEAPVPAGGDLIELPPLPEGGYAVSVSGGARPLHTAVEVLANPVSRLRYGFVASYPPGRELEPVLRWFRRLHLTGAQFYDWAYRHADLISPAPEYADPLGQPISLDTVRALASGMSGIGTAPIGYAAVYGVGNDEWPRWEHAALLAPDGTPYRLADFLSLVDPSDPSWLAHFTADLARAVDTIGLTGFHLDQYGYPRRAVRPDGRVVDVAPAFDALIRAVRERLPEATLIFNNVNDFPVWTTTSSPQDVTYTEFWQPHDNLGDLAAAATRMRALAPARPAVAAAYQEVYREHPVEAADQATRLTMATLFSHGATQLLAGEAGRILVDPYYVNNHGAETSTMDLLARWYDLLVAAGDVLLAPGVTDVTRSVTGALNDEIDVLGDVAVTHDPDPGVVWRRVVETPHGIAVHLINLVAQAETGWDTPKSAPAEVTGLRLRARRVGSGVPMLRVADPDRGPGFTEIPMTADGNHAHADLPPLAVWQLLLISDQ